MISTSIRATWSRTCTSILALGALTASSAFADVARPDMRASRVPVDRGTLGQFELATANPQVYQIRVLSADGSLVTDPLAVVDAAGELVMKVRPGADGTFAFTGTFEQKFGVSASGASIGNGLIGDFALPASNLDVIDVVLPGDAGAVSTHSASQPSSGFAGGLNQTGLGTRDLAMLVGAPDCNVATPLSVPGTDAGTTVGQSTIPAEIPGIANCGVASGMGSAAVWYQIVGNGNIITVETCGPSTILDTVLHVWRQCGTPCSSTTLTCVGANDDACAFGGGGSAFASRVTFPSSVGTIYKVAVSGFGTGSGVYTINTFNGAPAVNPPVCPPPPVPTGACCVTNTPPFEQGEVPVECSEQTAADCAAAGGTYGGDDVPCETGTITLTRFDVSPNTPIPDANIAGINSNITVPSGFGSVLDVNVELDITHTWIGDLDIDLDHNGDSVNIWDNRCGSTDNMHATADDEGTETFCAPINSGAGDGDADGFPSDTVLYSVPIAALGLLSDYDGGPASGVWTLHVADEVGADLGVLNHWGLNLTSLTNIVPQCAPFDCPPPPPCDSCCEPCPDPVPCDSCCPDPEPCPEDGRVELCHIPPGNQFNAHTIAVGPAAVQHHLDHGDTLGECP